MIRLKTHRICRWSLLSEMETHLETEMETDPLTVTDTRQSLGPSTET